MINYVRGDILLAFKNGDLDAMAHGCNCRGGFGFGVAGQIATQFPQVKEAYLKLHREGGAILGFFQPILVDKQYIINCGTQDGYGSHGVYANYDAINDVLESLSLFTLRKFKRIGIPMIGSGLAGGDWSKIEKLVFKHFTDHDIKVYIYP